MNHMVQFQSPRLDAAFAALSHATRRGILERLGRTDASITELAGRFDMTLTGMKKHIAILEEEGLVENAKSGVGAYLRRKWLELGDHPIVGEARMTGMIGALELVPDRKSRKRFPEEGKAGTICRNISVKNDLIMRACWDRMVVSPPLSITEAEVDELIERAKKTLDETVVAVKKEGLA